MKLTFKEQQRLFLRLFSYGLILMAGIIISFVYFFNPDWFGFYMICVTVSAMLIGWIIPFQDNIFREERRQNLGKKTIEYSKSTDQELLDMIIVRADYLDLWQKEVVDRWVKSIKVN